MPLPQTEASTKVPGRPPPGRGRPLGSVNKLGLTAKETIEKAAQGLGGFKRLIAWAKEDPINERLFWSSIYPKLMPQQQTMVAAAITLNVSKTESGF